MSDPGYERGQGPQALGYGEATQANANQPPPPDPAFGPLSLDQEDIPVQFAPNDEPPDTSVGSDDEQILLDDRDPNYEPSMRGRDRKGRVPRYVVRHVMQLRAAARDPSAHPTLRAYYADIVRNLEIEQTQGGR